MMYVAHKIEIKPNKFIQKQISEAFGYSRYIYNKALVEWKRMYNLYKEDSSNPKPTNWKVRSNLKRNKLEWESTQQTQILDTSCDDLSKAFNMFFKGISKYPKFKSKKKSKNTCRFYRKNEYTIKIINDKYLKLPKLEPIKMKEKLRFKGIIKEVTISKKANKYFASFIIDSDIKVRPNTNGKFAGIDLGIKTFAVVTDSDNNYYEYESILNNLKPLYNKISCYQRRLSKKNRYSNKYNVMKTKLQKIYLRISNIQNDYLHKITTELIQDYQYITIEDLNVSGMLKNRKLSKVISRSLFYTFKIFLEYKAKMYNNTIIIADRWFPSSQTCSNCGNVLKKENKLKLSNRVYKCKKCDNIIDRDVNAAINLKLYGMHQVGLQP